MWIPITGRNLRILARNEIRPPGNFAARSAQPVTLQYFRWPEGPVGFEFPLSFQAITLIGSSSYIKTPQNRIPPAVPGKFPALDHGQSRSGNFSPSSLSVATPLAPQGFAGSCPGRSSLSLFIFSRKSCPRAAESCLRSASAIRLFQLPLPVLQSGGGAELRAPHGAIPESAAHAHP